MLDLSWRVLVARLEARSSICQLKVAETPDVWLTESTLARTPVVWHDQVEPMLLLHFKLVINECLIVLVPRGRRCNDGGL